MTTKDQNNQQDEPVEFITKEQAEKNQPKSVLIPLESGKFLNKIS